MSLNRCIVLFTSGKTVFQADEPCLPCVGMKITIAIISLAIGKSAVAIGRLGFTDVKMNVAIVRLSFARAKMNVAIGILDLAIVKMGFAIAKSAAAIAKLISAQATFHQMRNLLTLKTMKSSFWNTSLKFSGWVFIVSNGNCSMVAFL